MSNQEKDQEEENKYDPVYQIEKVIKETRQIVDGLKNLGDKKNEVLKNSFYQIKAQLEEYMKESTLKLENKDDLSPDDKIYWTYADGYYKIQLNYLAIDIQILEDDAEKSIERTKNNITCLEYKRKLLDLKKYNKSNYTKDKFTYYSTIIHTQ